MKYLVLAFAVVGLACAGSPEEAGSMYPDCKGEWPAAWVAQEQALVAAVNAARVRGGTCSGVAFAPVSPLASDPLLTQIGRCFLRDQAAGGSNALVGGAVYAALLERAVAAGYQGQPLEYSLDVLAPSVEEGLASLLAVQCPVIFDPHAESCGIGYLADPSGAVPQRWAGLMAAAPEVLPKWVSSPGPGRQVELAGVNLAGAEFGEPVPGVSGTYPTAEEIDYFVARGMNVFRFPFLWERMQRTLYGDLDAEEIARLERVVAHATGAGAVALLDPHNYARRGDAIIGTDALPNTAFADFWARIANVFQSDPRVVFALMNEPHDLGVGGTARWLTSANAAIAAIRATSAMNLVLVPGDHWTGAWTWTARLDGASNAEVMIGVEDPANNFAYEVHQYLDSDSSGGGMDCVRSTIGVDRVTTFTAWARTAGVRAFLGEFGAPATNTCFHAIDRLLGYLGDNADVWMGWSWWAAGPLWGAYRLSIEPSNGTEAPQMAVLDRYLSLP